ncbi:unnamed protein product [Penicillium salamii]|uniref:Uncharacterized protein n=1 Tax=Penicillium salamii TaxID=1612424 RepID=A0A9W4IZP6_9EURO|nr:unnamed protein product [Penicillium salamii]CAG8022919.1 unnamed protein product [Penicillium salamii]CAG8130107.1 unnamed protein product [Penicillium salamii]CAG8323648.1 unnamed protein product [Penicillium salamii]CAG8348019.1 unnamed protein product [Penicillium salamii]
MLDLPQRNPQVSIHQNWITLRNKNIVWLPPEYRPTEYQPTCFTAHESVLAIGHSSGRVSFMGFQLNSE